MLAGSCAGGGQPPRQRIGESARSLAIYFVAPAGALSAVLLMFGLPGDTWLRLGAWLLFGLVIYFFYGVRHSRVANETVQRWD